MSYIKLLVFLMIVCAAIVVIIANESPIVETDSGQIQGYMETSSGGRSFYTFRSIPFAKPPIGKLRFQNPEKYGSWQGLLDGKRLSNVCPQPNLQLYLYNQTKLYDGEEDCLYLSVYTPKIIEKKLPVLFFIHGGAFVVGSGDQYASYDFMNEDVVLVIANYRLGILGFLSTEDEVMPGNLGLKDQTIALEWVRDNIKYFGGDREKVTIFGQSAGGASVHFHVLYPISKGLFTRAILQSGTALCPWTYSSGQRSIALQVGAAVGCFTPTEFGPNQSERLLSCLQTVDAKTLTMTFSNFMNFTFMPLNFNPFVDGKYITDEPETILKAGKQNNIDLIIGSNRDEGAFFAKSILYESDFYEKLQQNFGYYGPVSLGLLSESQSEEMAARGYKYYLNKLTVDENDAAALSEMTGHRHFIICSDSAAFLHSQSNKVFSYEFNYRGEFSFSAKDETDFGDNWISHGDDIIYMLFNRKNSGETIRNEADSKMSAIFTRLWANFARTGNPTVDDSLGFQWEVFSQDNPKQLSLTLKPEMVDYNRKEVYNFWSSLPLAENERLHGSCKNVFRRDEL